jgi:hypothetical protein
VREYRDRYPDKALMPMEEGVGPVPILMAGAASESGLKTQAPTPPPTALENATAMYPQQVPSRQVPAPLSNANSIIDRFVHTYLATELMKMSPKDGWVAAPVLIYSLAGADITLASQLPGKEYKAMWFDPRTGSAQDVPSMSGTATAVLTKPDTREWLLLLTPQDR